MNILDIFNLSIMWIAIAAQLYVLKRLKRGEGSGGPSGFTDAKREVEPDGPEERERSERPQSLAVSPVEDLASFERCCSELNKKVAELREQQIHARETNAMIRMDDAIEASATIIEGIVEFLTSIAPKPESEQPRKPPVVPQPNPRGCPR